MSGWRKRQVIEMAREAGFEGCAELTWEGVICTEELERFAALVRAEALAQPQQEPVAWQWLGSAHFRKKLPKNADITAWNSLYSAPQRTWVGLTDEDDIDWEDGGNLKDLVKAIEAKLRSKNT